MTSSIQMTEHEELSTFHYDAYKSVHGIRPRWIDYDALTIDNLNTMLEELSKESEIVAAEERALEEKAVVEVQQMIQNTINAGARDRAQALKWLTDAEDFLSIIDVDQWLWSMGIMFTDYGRELKEELYQNFNESQ